MAINSSKKAEATDTNNLKKMRESISPDRQIITAYGPKLRVQHANTGEGGAKQSFKEECDINRIMARYQVTGVLPEIIPGTPQYVDVTGIDYQVGMQKIAAAQSLFEGLPAAVRLKFKNDPGEFLDFAQDPSNQDALVEMGLATRPLHAPLELDTSSPPAAAARASRAPKTSGTGPSDPPTQPLPGIPEAEK